MNRKTEVHKGSIVAQLADAMGQIGDVLGVIAAAYKRISDSFDEALRTAFKRTMQDAPLALPAPLTPEAQEVWDLLQGRQLTGKQIAVRLEYGPGGEDMIRKRIKSLRNSGRRIESVPQHGYWRPDAPPDAGVPEAVRSESG